MSSLDRSFDLPDVDAFIAGTVGPAGEQVIALAEYLSNMLTDLPEPDAVTVPVASGLATPVEPEWAVASMGVAYVESRDRVALWAEQMLLSEDDSSPATSRFQLTRGQVLAFVTHATGLVTAGRPPCPYCEAPLSTSDDGWCPCWN